MEYRSAEQLPRINPLEVSQGGLIRPFHSKLIAIYRVSDMLWMFLTLFALCEWFGISWNFRHTLALVSVVAIYSFFATSNGVYRSWRVASTGDELKGLWYSWIATSISILLLIYTLKILPQYPQFLILPWLALTPVILSLWRILWRTIWHELRKLGYNSRTVAIVGMNQLGAHVAQTIQNATWMGLRLHGFYDDRAKSNQRLEAADDQTLLGTVDDLIKKQQAGELDMVYITLPMRGETRINEIVDRLADTTASVYVVPDLFLYDMLHSRWGNLGDMPVVGVYESPFYSVDGWVKRIEDIVLGSLILALAAIPMLLIALGIKLTSRGPVLFKQRRYGINGKEIYVWKFRTMTVCEDGEDVRQAGQNDARVTRFGRFLRHTSLDELPQFFNVLRGNMSIVGPRPHAVNHNEQYRKLIHGYMLRHKVKPGITGFAQINGWRGETDTLNKMENRVAYDLEYIRNWSLFLDVKIIIQTALIMFTDKNAC